MRARGGITIENDPKRALSRETRGWLPCLSPSFPSAPPPPPPPAPPTSDNCPLRHSPTDCYIVRTRRSREDGNLASQCPSEVTPQPATTAHYAIAPPIATLFVDVVPVQTGTSHPAPVRVYGRHLAKPTTTAHYAIAPPIATLFVDVVPVQTGTSHPAPVRVYGRHLAKPTTTAPYAIAPLIATLFAHAVLDAGGDPLSLCEKAEDEGSDDRECDEMQPNATELKVSPLLATPDEASQGHNQGQLAHHVGVNGVPNEATVASFPASRLGVNETKQGQIGPGFTPPSSVIPAKVA